MPDREGKTVPYFLWTNYWSGEDSSLFPLDKLLIRGRQFPISFGQTTDQACRWKDVHIFCVLRPSCHCFSFPLQTLPLKTMDSLLLGLSKMCVCVCSVCTVCVCVCALISTLHQAGRTELGWSQGALTMSSENSSTSRGVSGIFPVCRYLWKKRPPKKDKTCWNVVWN